MDSNINIFAVVYGNISDGFSYFGPFSNFVDAQKFAELADEPYNIVDVSQTEYDDIKTDPTGHFLLLKGDPIEGFEHIGPFKNKKAAYSYAELCLMTDYYIVEMETP